MTHQDPVARARLAGEHPYYAGFAAADLPIKTSLWASTALQQGIDPALSQ
ncbi:MAG: hypothetical protein ACUVRV_04880 [Cyanobacteriota bacterium]